jgi:hypothetical protein
MLCDLARSSEQPGFAEPEFVAQFDHMAADTGRN